MRSIDDNTNCKNDVVEKYKRGLINRLPVIHYDRLPLPRDLNNQAIDLGIPTEKLSELYIDLFGVERKEIRKARESAAKDIYDKLLGSENNESSLSGKMQLLFSALLTNIREQQMIGGEKIDRDSTFNLLDAIEDHKRLLLLGSPGSGKSTFLRNIVHHLIKTKNERIPVFLSLQEYALYSLNSEDATIEDYAFEKATLNRPEFEHLLGRHEGIVWLLDGLDECFHIRNDIVEQIEQLQGHIIITSRLDGYTDTRLKQYHQIELLPIRYKEALDYIYKWYHLYTRKDVQHKNRIKGNISWIENNAKKNLQFKNLLKTPLTLSFLTLQLLTDPLPELSVRRTDVYKIIIQKLYPHWELSKDTQNKHQAEFCLGSLKGEDAKQACIDILYHIGYFQHLNYANNNNWLPDREVFIEQIAPVIAIEWGISPGQSKSAIREAIKFWIRANVLKVFELKKRKFLTFTHLNLQEYCAAMVLNKMRKRDEKRLWQFLRVRLHNYKWNDCIIMLLGLWEQNEINKFIRYLKKNPSKFENILHRDFKVITSILSEHQYTEKATYTPYFKKRFYRCLTTNIATPFVRPILFILGLGLFIHFYLYFTGRIPPIHPIKPSSLLDSFNPIHTIGLFKPSKSNIIGYISCGIAMIPVLNPILTRYTSIFYLFSFVYLPFRFCFIPPPLGLLTYWLRNSGHMPIEWILPLLHHKKTDIRLIAIECLSHFETEDAIKVLVSMLHDKDVSVQEKAINSLKKYPNLDLYDHLKLFLLHSKKEVRIAAIEAMGVAKEKKAASDLLSLIDDKDEAIKRAAVIAIGEIGDKAAIKPISKLVDYDSYFGYECVKVLDKIGGIDVTKALIGIIKKSATILNAIEKESLEVSKSYVDKDKLISKYYVKVRKPIEIKHNGRFCSQIGEFAAVALSKQFCEESMIDFVALLYEAFYTQQENEVLADLTIRSIVNIKEFNPLSEIVQLSLEHFNTKIKELEKKGLVKEIKKYTDMAGAIALLNYYNGESFIRKTTLDHLRSLGDIDQSHHIRFLGYTNNKKVVPILKSISKVCNENVRTSICKALSNIDGKEAINALIDLYFEWINIEDLRTQYFSIISYSCLRQKYNIIGLIEERINLRWGMAPESEDLDYQYIRSKMKEDKYTGIHYLEKVSNPQHVLQVSKYIFSFSSEIRKAALNAISSNIENVNNNQIIKKIRLRIWWIASDPTIRIGANFIGYEDDLLSCFEKTCNHLDCIESQGEMKDPFFLQSSETPFIYKRQGIWLWILFGTGLIYSCVWFVSNIIGTVLIERIKHLFVGKSYLALIAALVFVFVIAGIIKIIQELIKKRT